jgi:ribosomal protein L37AE/L43A
MFQCSHCDKSYLRKTHLIRHEATRELEPLTEGVQTDKFLDKQQLSSSCPFCGKSFLKR